MTSDELTCQELVELITDYLEQTLLPVQRARFEEHLASCDGCDIYLEQMRKTVQLVGKLVEDAIAPEIKGELLEIFRDWKRSDC